jgi:hypothetical protein
LEDDDVVEGGGCFEEVEGVEEGVGVGEEVVALFVFFRASWGGGEDEWCYYLTCQLLKSNLKLEQTKKLTDSSGISRRRL